MLRLKANRDWIPDSRKRNCHGHVSRSTNSIATLSISVLPVNRCAQLILLAMIVVVLPCRRGCGVDQASSPRSRLICHSSLRFANSYPAVALAHEAIRRSSAASASVRSSKDKEHCTTNKEAPSSRMRHPPAAFLCMPFTGGLDPRKWLLATRYMLDVGPNQVPGILNSAWLGPGSSARSSAPPKYRGRRRPQQATRSRHSGNFLECSSSHRSTRVEPLPGT